MTADRRSLGQVVVGGRSFVVVSTMNDKNKPLIGAGILFQLSFAIVGAMLVPLLIGIWLDRTFNTGPIGVLILAVIGVGLGSLAVYRIVKDAYDQLNGT